VLPKDTEHMTILQYTVNPFGASKFWQPQVTPANADTSLWKKGVKADSRTCETIQFEIR
jgi:hypothetical protein